MMRLATLLCLAAAPIAAAQCNLDVIAPFDIIAGDAYGVSCDIGPDLALVGAYDAGLEAGAVYALHRIGDVFELDHKLMAADADPFDQFGSAVALCADVAVIGAPLDEVNGFASGSAYVFEYLVDDNHWQQAAKLLAFDASPYDVYALATATNADFAFIGCPEDDDVDVGAGSVYVYARTEDWAFTQKLLALDAAAGDRFGESIDADGDTLVVGASHVNTDGVSAGAAYVFVREGDTWIQQARLVPPQPEFIQSFGISVSIDDDFIAIGAPHADAGAVDGGAVYAFRRIGDEWVLESTVTPDDVAPDDFFGSCVSIGDQELVVGSNAPDPRTDLVGSAYVFARAPGGDWKQIDRLAPPVEHHASNFGWSVGVAGDTAIVGAPFGTGPSPNTGASFLVDLDTCICPADVDLDGLLSILDFVALQLAFVAADPVADVNGDGALDILDFVDFQLLFVSGCH
jgi:hypothetical protein